MRDYSQQFLYLPSCNTQLDKTKFSSVDNSINGPPVIDHVQSRSQKSVGVAKWIVSRQPSLFWMCQVYLFIIVHQGSIELHQSRLISRIQTTSFSNVLLSLAGCLNKIKNNQVYLKDYSLSYQAFHKLPSYAKISIYQASVNMTQSSYHVFLDMPSLYQVTPFSIKLIQRFHQLQSEFSLVLYWFLPFSNFVAKTLSGMFVS